ncbi:hypothetical protein UCRPC4_g03128 [Phaeomoniella chlamydospora]|uniref:Cryptic loci regulator 2 C-terminal domain-containing protein n=1 Tax=Phaeomoniella chlamydospora TaxID=158046 RepID=A0A0G2EIY4_PHACM|nr:hypothetical protein UCRPC4_g03128 [Phaeomoniella chlamydospora]
MQAINYKFKNLPSGYALFEVPKSDGSDVKLSSGKRINEKIKEPQSMDWRAERELVLWTVDLDHEIAFNQEHRQFQKYDFDKDKWLGCPEWMAGTVTQVAKDSGDFQDLVEDVDQDDAVNVSGYRVETLPDPNNDINKSLSKHYKYIPLRQIRPLSYWQQYLRGTDEKDIHPSVKHALTVASSISLVEKFRFRGKEKEAEIFCKGIYLGPELYIVGDAIRIMPEDDHQNCSDILVITSIRLRLHQISRETAFESRKLADQTSIRIYGHAYTTTATRSYAKDVPDGRPLNATELATLFPLVGMASLGNWYRLHDSNSRYEISFDRILGRLYEPAATCIWLNSPVASTSPKTILSFDIPAVRSARTYSRQTDARIANDRSWFWADTRAQTLALETFNGREVGPYDDEVRNQEALRKWRAHLRVLDNNYTEEDLLVTAPLESGSGKKRGRKPGSKLVNGKIVHPGQPGFDGTAGTRVASSRMVEAAFESSAEEEDSDGQDASGMKGLTLNVRRSVEKGPASKSNTDDDVPMKDVISSEEEPLPPHVERGGTDETDGGDYMPGFEDFQKRPEKKPKI